MKHLPTGIQNIEEILSNDFVYVDKTSFAYELITCGKHYFLSRPRRFGKSLFVSTLEQIFRGNKELFKGLKIYNSDYHWTPHPILHFDFSLIESETPDVLRQGLHETLEDIASCYGLSISGSSLKSQLKRLVTGLVAKEGRVVVLVDEYDQPIINHLSNIEMAEANREVLRSFFGALKGLDAQIEFTFITGVSKFSQVSVFSGLNNLTDITMEEEYSCMLGYTENEIKEHFMPHLKQIAEQQSTVECQVTEKQLLDQIRLWYNGYRFSRASFAVYNPFSTLKFMKLGVPKSYWYSTGTPSFLIQQVKQYPQAVVPLSGATALESTLSEISNLSRINLIALMFQTGYLTISDYDQEKDFYYLDFPNQEVRYAFFNSLIEEFAEIDPTDVAKSAYQIQDALNKFDINKIVKIMNSHFAKIAYQLFLKSQEGFYHAVFLTFLERSGIKTFAEVSTNIGRVDLIAQLPNAICIFELKLNKSAEVAFDQADAKKYKEMFSNDQKNVLVVGINFCSETRNISEWKAKLFSPKGDELKKF